jgi:hypothetical protein
VPSSPKVEKFLSISRLRHADIDFVYAKTLLWIASHAIFTFAVHSDKLGTKLRGLRSESGFGWSRYGINPQKHDLAGDISRQMERVETMRLGNKLVNLRNSPGGNRRGERLRVIGDIGASNPTGAGVLDTAGEKRGIDTVHERASLFYGWFLRSCGRSALGMNSYRTHTDGETGENGNEPKPRVVIVHVALS